MRLLRGAAAIGLLLLVGVAPATAQTAVKTSDVRIVDFSYEANRVEVDAGTTVTWTNTGARPHTVTDRGGTFDSNPVAPGAKTSISFTVPRTYASSCRVNPSKSNGVGLLTPGPAPALVDRIHADDP